MKAKFRKIRSISFLLLSFGQFISKSGKNSYRYELKYKFIKLLLCTENSNYIEDIQDLKTAMNGINVVCSFGTIFGALVCVKPYLLNDCYANLPSLELYINETWSFSIYLTSLLFWINLRFAYNEHNFWTQRLRVLQSYLPIMFLKRSNAADSPLWVAIKSN